MKTPLKICERWEILMSSMKKLHIQPAAESDVKSIAGIVKKSFVQYCNAIGIDTMEALQESEQDVRRDLLHKHVYVAYWEGIPVGSLRVEIKGEKAYISRFAILPEYQGLGIGSEMLSFAEKSLVSSPAEMVELYSAVENSRLKDFYLSKGYQIASIECSKGYQRGLFRKTLHKV